MASQKKMKYVLVSGGVISGVGKGSIASEYKRKHPVFPVSLIKHFNENYKEKFPLRNEIEELPPIDHSTEKEIWKILKHRILKDDKNKQCAVHRVMLKIKPLNSLSNVEAPSIRNQLIEEFTIILVLKMY